MGEASRTLAWGADHRVGAAIRALSNALNAMPAPWMVIGGVAVIAAGVPRETVDIDVAVLGRATDFDSLLGTLAHHGITPRIEDVRRFARERQVLLLQHDASGITTEISFARLPFEGEALSAANRVEFDGVVVPVARPEDLIVSKTAAWRDRARAGVERLLVLHLETTDLDHARALVVAIASALDEPERITAFDELVARARRTR